jgi:hypothetical protein
MRLHHALSTRRELFFTEHAVVCKRLTLTRLPRPTDDLLAGVSHVMSRAVRRCRECGHHTRRKYRVCSVCMHTPDTFLSVVTRADIHAMNHARAWRLRPTALLRRIAERLVPIAKGRTGAFLYWRRDVDARVFCD